MKKSIKDRVAVIGTGVTKFGERWEKSADDLIADAVLAACKEANVDLQKDVEAGWVGVAYDSTGTSGNVMTDPVAFYGKPVTRVENYCCTGMDSFRNAAYAVAAGIYDIVIATGVEKLLDTGGSGLKMDMMYPHNTLIGQSAPGIFAPGALRAFKEYGWTKEDLARVAVKNHHNGVKHPKAHFRKEITLETAVNAPMICYPLGLFDCCAISDGAAALILTTPEIAKDRVGSGNYATVKAVSQAVFTKYPFNDPNYTGISVPSTVQAGVSAYEQAGIQNPRKELDFGIVHDCFTFAELLHYQDLGLCGTGESADLIREGVTAIDGDFPINPDGGLKCFGHPIGATGCRMVAELTKQVLGKAEGYQVKDAKAGLAHNLGGPLSIGMVSIVGTPEWEAGG